jgi:hypothetical protein
VDDRGRVCHVEARRSITRVLTLAAFVHSGDHRAHYAAGADE